MPRNAGKRTSKKPADEIKVKLDDGYALSNDIIDAILRLSPSGIAIIGPDFVIEYISDRGCMIFGGTREELMGHDFRNFLQEDSLRLVAERYQLRRDGKEVPSVYPFHLIRSDGEE